MNAALYGVAILLVLLWGIGYFGYEAGGLIHILLIIAVLALLLRVIRGSKV